MNASVSFRYDSRNITHVFSPEEPELRVDDTLTVTAKLTPNEAYGALEWVLTFSNPSERESGRLSELWDCDALIELEMAPCPRAGYLPGEEGPWLTAMKGMVDGQLYMRSDPVSSTEFSLERTYLRPDEPLRCANVNSRSSDGRAPFFDVQSLSAGAVIAIGWTGGWKAEFTREEGGVRVRTGLRKLDTYLKPGESFRTSSVLIMPYAAGEDGPNKFRRLIRDHYSHVTGRPGTREGILAAELWGGLTSEEMCRRLRAYREHGVKLEDAWIDAGWYGECTKCDDCYTGDWYLNTGNWTSNSRVHPDDLEDVRDAAAENGMRLLLWYETERAIASVPPRREHPDWYLYKKTADGGRDESCILWYGNREALEHTCSFLSAEIRRLNLSVYRQDFNIPLDDFFDENDEPGRAGMTELLHITGMYELWDRLLEEFPGLIIDNCSSGGRRIDVETLRRSIPFFRSDYQCAFNPTPEVMQVHNSNVARYLPCTGCTTKTKSDTYAVRSAYSTSFGLAFWQAIFQEVSGEDLDWAAALVEEYRRIRPVFSRDFHNLGSAVWDETAWAAWQYHDPESGRGVVLCFRRAQSPFDRASFSLGGIPGDARLSMTLTNDAFETVKQGLLGGLLRSGDPRADWKDGLLTVCLPEKRTSLLIEYQVK